MLTTISNRINTLLLLVLILMAGAIITMLATRAYGGPLDPPGAPSATGTLPQVEPRSPIPPVGWNGTFPIQITQPGSYFLTRNLTVSVTNVSGIAITASDVALDLNGFTLSGFDKTGDGIFANTAWNVSVTHGAVTRFGDGIDLHQVSVGHISDVQVYQSGNMAISPPELGYLEDCVVQDAGGEGVHLHPYTVMRRCSVFFTGLNGANTGRDGVYAEYYSLVEDNVIVAGSGANPDNRPFGVRSVGPNVTIKNNVFRDNGRRDVLVTTGPATVIDNDVTCTASVVEASPSIMNAPMGNEPHANIPRVAVAFC